MEKSRAELMEEALYEADIMADCYALLMKNLGREIPLSVKYYRISRALSLCEVEKDEDLNR